LGGSAQILVGGMTPDLAYAATRRALTSPRPPTALFAATHVMALGALRAIWDAGFVVPDTISVLAFDDCDWMTALRPFISTIRQPIDAMAREAWTILMNRL